ncbi:uncharacterized protein LOC128003208 isoform X1 [Carassius gibelio]|uniref:uncharacterized protein LOC128003208 isoform X1 n=1 Tax=Carassius gibelio TaxID=101364 RepID=UPI00227884FA|nr:uncharacterized protein LOC128003208 isoform X1 [Carassius gibelio]
MWHIFPKDLYRGCCWIFAKVTHFLEIVQTFFHYMWHNFPKDLYRGCCRIFAKVTNHFLETVQTSFSNMWQFFKRNLYRGCCWIFAKVKEKEERKMYPYQVQKFEPFLPNQGKYYVIEMGKSGDLRKQILGHLQKKRAYLEEVHSVDDCNVILVFCPIVSRAGTDIDAALNELNTCSETASKPAILMVFHHSFDCYKTVPDSSRSINRRNTLTVDCLFNEDEGLLACERNDEALAKIVQCFKNQHFLEIVQTSFIWNIFPKNLQHGCCSLFAKVMTIWPGKDRGTYKSSTYTERSRLIYADEESKNENLKHDVEKNE